MASTSSLRRRGPRRAFSEGEVLDAAQELLDEGGPEAASVRGIAKKLGVAPNTIYTYYPDKAAILAALVERLLGGVDHGVFADRNQSWRQRVEAVALELREQLAAHPGAVGLIVGGPLSGPHALALNERTRELFAEAGLDSADAVRASHVLLVYILGSLALEIAHPEAPDLELPSGEGRAATGSGVADPQRGRVPPDGATRDGPARHASTDQYLWGLHRTLDGLSRSSTHA